MLLSDALGGAYDPSLRGLCAESERSLSGISSKTLRDRENTTLKIQLEKKSAKEKFV